MKKRILIDASTVISKIDGLSQYIINLIKHLPEESFDIFDYSVLVNKDLNRNALTDILKDQRFSLLILYCQTKATMGKIVMMIFN